LVSFQSIISWKEIKDLIFIYAFSIRFSLHKSKFSSYVISVSLKNWTLFLQSTTYYWNLIISIVFLRRFLFLSFWRMTSLNSEFLMGNPFNISNISLYSLCLNGLKSNPCSSIAKVSAVWIWNVKQIFI
jgi:hypothetical protein